MNESLEERGDKILEDLNEWGIKKGYKPIYKSFDDYVKTIKQKPEKAITKLRRANQYFHTGSIKGTKPSLSTYFTITHNKQLPTHISDDDSSENLELDEDEKALKDDLMNNSKSDFLFKQMNAPKEKRLVQATGNLLKDYAASTGPSRGFNDEDYVKKYKSGMDNIFGITGQGFNISHNPNYLRKDYFDTVVASKHPDWTLSRNEDLDGDEHNDVVIRDKKGNIRVFNGYSLGSNKFALSKLDYLTNPTTTDFTNQAFLDEYHKTHPQKAPRDYKAVIKRFVKILNKRIKKALKGNKEGMMYYNNSGFAGRMESILTRFGVLPFVLYIQGYKNEEEIRKVLFAQRPAAGQSNPLYSTLLRIYRDFSDSRKIKNTWNDPRNKKILAKVISVISADLFSKIQNNAYEFVKLVINGNDFSIGKACYTSAVNVINSLASGELDINTIDENGILKQMEDEANTQIMDME